MANPVTWFEIIGNDPIKLQKFYHDVFNWQLSPPVAEMGNYSMLHGEGGGIGGGIGGTMGGPTRVTVYIEVDDPDAYLKRITDAGGTTIMPTTQITPETTIAMFTDPEGHVVGLLKANPR